jgi:hypothetical protein
MITKLSIEGRLSDFLREQDASVEFFCALLPENFISVSRVRQALAGNRDLENRHHDAIDRLLRELQALASDHDPVLIRWERPQIYRDILAARRGDKPRLPAYAVMIGEDQYFVSCTPSKIFGNPEINTSVRQAQATSMTADLARQVVDKLAARGLKAEVVHALFVDDFSGAASSLDQVWTEPAVEQSS